MLSEKPRRIWPWLSKAQERPDAAVEAKKMAAIMARQIANAGAAKTVLDKFPDPEGKLRYFHLRPASGGITLVSTYVADGCAHRGIKGIGVDKIGGMLEMAARAVSDAGVVDLSAIQYRGAGARKPESFARLRKETEAEAVFRAKFINHIVFSPNGENVRCYNAGLRAERLFFLGSEVILGSSPYSGKGRFGKRIDVVAHDGNGKVLLLLLRERGASRLQWRLQAAQEMFEEKKFREMLWKYDGNRNFKKLLKAYPARHPVDRVKSFAAWVVEKGDEDADEPRFKRVRL